MSLAALAPLARFSAADDPWIDVRDHALYHQVGLRDLFLRAHALTDLALPMPPAASALLRIAVAITARITGLDDPDLSADRWNARRRSLLEQEAGFDPDAVHAYFDAHHFQVFDQARPWLQDPSLPGQCDKRAGVGALDLTRPTGNNLAWFSPHHDHNPQPLPTARALQHLLVHHYYGRAGNFSTRTTGATGPKGSPTGTSGPLRGTVSFHPLGRTVYETLLAGVPKFLGDEQAAPDRCPWEGPEPPDPGRPLPPVTWPGRLLTGRSRHAVLLIPGADGSTVVDAYLTWATQHPKLEATDPYLVYRVDADKPVERRRQTRLADADRAWWRELDALLLASDEHRTTFRPEIFDTFNDLPQALRADLRVRVHGFEQEAKANNRQWYTAITPPLLNWSQENDPQRAQRIAECCRAAEQTALRLVSVADQAWKDTTIPQSESTPGGGEKKKRKPGAWTLPARTRYWVLAEPLFWKLLDEPETPAETAFAAAAADALRQVTETARIRHRGAGRAVATAVAALYRSAPRTPARRSN